MLIVIALFFGIDVMPRDIVQVAYALLTAVLLGVGFGLLNGVIALVAPPWMTGYALVMLTLWFSSGIFFVPDALPAAARDILAYNPILAGGGVGAIRIL